MRWDKKELSLRVFLKDAFEEIFNVDSKFLKTLRLLLTKPGFLTNEAIAGRKVPYIKPFRLYVIAVVLHFLIFSFFKSGDIFTIDRFPIFQLVPGIHQIVKKYELKSDLSHEVFTVALNQKIKDNLTVLVYFLVFILALYFKLLYLHSGKYYIEHLYCLLHLMSFALFRNVMLIPLLMFDFVAVAVVILLTTQLAYIFISLRTVYHESLAKTVVKVALVMMGFFLVFIPGIFISMAIGILQIIF